MHTKRLNAISSKVAHAPSETKRPPAIRIFKKLRCTYIVRADSTKLLHRTANCFLVGRRKIARDDAIPGAIVRSGSEWPKIFLYLRKTCQRTICPATRAVSLVSEAKWHIQTRLLIIQSWEICLLNSFEENFYTACLIPSKSMWLRPSASILRF